MTGSELIEWLARFIVRRRLAVIACGAAVTLCLANGILHLRIEVDPDTQLPQGHRFVLSFHEMTRLFGDKNALVVAARPTSGDIFDAAFLTKLQDLTSEICEIPGCNRALLKGLASDATRQVSVQGDTLYVSRALPDPPTTANLATLREQILADRLIANTLVAKNGAATAIYATFELTPDTPGYIDIYRRAVAIADRFRSDGSVDLYLAGPIAVVATLTEYSKQALALLPLSLLIIALVHFEAFRTWSGVALPILTGVLSVVWSMGIMGYCGVTIDPLNATTPVLILAVGAGHAVQILKRYYEYYFEHGDPGEAVVSSLTSTAPATIAACTIAASSFGSLVALQTESMRTFGVFTALGIACVLAIEILLMPALRAMSSPPTHRNSATMRRNSWDTGILSQLGRALADRATANWVILGYGVIALACAPAVSQLSSDSSLIRQFPLDAPIRKDNHFINEHFSGTSILFVLLSGDQPGAFTNPQTLNSVVSFQHAVEALPSVGRVLSIADTLHLLHEGLSGLPPQTGSAGDSDLRPFPNDHRLIDQYLLLYSMSGGSDLFTMLTPDYRSAKVTILLKDDSTLLGRQTIKQIETIAKDTLPASIQIRIAGTIASDLALTETVVRGKLVNIVQVATLTVLFSAILLRSITLGILISAPLALSVLVNFALMWIFKIPLDVTTAAASAMSVGLGADYAIYLLFRLREELSSRSTIEEAFAKTLASSGQAILLVAAAITLGYSVLAHSGFRIYTHLSLLIGAAMTTSSIASVVVLPAAIRILLDSAKLSSTLGAGTDHKNQAARHESAPRTHAGH